jgi:hypothetical protein
MVADATLTAAMLTCRWALVFGAEWIEVAIGDSPPAHRASESCVFRLGRLVGGDDCSAPAGAIRGGTGSDATTSALVRQEIRRPHWGFAPRPRDLGHRLVPFRSTQAEPSRPAPGRVEVVQP